MNESSSVASKSIRVQLSVNSTAEQSEEYGAVLCSLRGVPSAVAANMKSFKLELSAFDGEIPEQYDGLAVELDPSADDAESDRYTIPANFKVIEIAEQAYKPSSKKIDMAEYLKSLGL